MHKRTFLILLIALLAVGCSAFFAAAYDPDVDRGLTELRTKLDGHFARLQRTAGTPGGAWQLSSGFYDSVRADIDTLRFYAALRRGNAPTLQALDLLSQNIDEFEALHREGLSPGEIPIARSFIDAQLRTLAELEQAKKRGGKEAS